MGKQQVLALLHQANGGFISGQQISTRLNVSRAAIWKDIEALRRDGYIITSVTGKGYSLVSAPNRLTEGDILPYLKNQDIKSRLIVLDTIDSTNTYAKQLALHDFRDGTAIVANQQTGGRGRLGRSFLSPADSGIYLSLLYSPQVAPAQAVNLTAYVAVAVCDGIQAACGVRPGIKWTNDIVLGNRKLAGILTEMAVEGETGTLQYLVTGIGVNVLQQQSDFPAELHSIATSLAMEGIHVSRGRLAAELINALDTMYDAWLRNTGDYWQRYCKDCITIGKQVRILQHGKEETAFAQGLDPDFGLIVRDSSGKCKTITSGEVSVRGLYGYI